MIRPIVLILIAGLLGGEVRADDILSRGHQVGETLRVELQGALQRITLQRATPFHVVGVLQRILKSGERERVFLLASDGSVFASASGSPAFSPALLDQIVSEPIGVGTYHAFRGDYSDVVRRDLGWSRQEVAGRAWIVVVERDRRLERDPEAPLTGRWMGAYSYSGTQVGGGAPAVKEAGPLSVLMLQEGTRCELRATSQRWNGPCRGWVSGTTLTAAADSSPGKPTLILEATYEPAADKIRGILHLAGSTEAGQATVFLQRAPE